MVAGGVGSVRRSALLFAAGYVLFYLPVAAALGGAAWLLGGYAWVLTLAGGVLAIVLGLAALSIAVASVTGRYHYAADAIAGAAAAVLAFVMVSSVRAL